jgi:hypothetical protein
MKGEPTMDRRAFRCRALATAAILATALVAGGCNIVKMAAYMIQGADVPAEFPGLKGKKVAVICRPPENLHWGNDIAAKDLAQQVSMLLKKNVPKINVIDPQNVAAWFDEHTFKDYPQVGKDLKAEMVVAVEINSFETHEGPMIFKGKADISIKVYDLTQKPPAMVKKIVIPQSLYPPGGGVVEGGQMSEGEFRGRFVHWLADQIGRYFYAHDRHADFAQDAEIGLR